MPVATSQRDFFIRPPLVHVELMVALEQLNLSVEQSHRGNNGQTDCGGENHSLSIFVSLYLSSFY